MADPVGLKLGEQLARPIRIQVLHPGAAVGGDDARDGGIRLQQARHKTAPSGLEMAQHPHFLCKARLRIRAVVGLEHPPVETDLDGRPERIFHLQHAEANLPRRRRSVKRSKTARFEQGDQKEPDRHGQPGSDVKNASRDFERPQVEMTLF